ncbi:MAG: hypothetical protein MZV65_25785 [Chromatiales bacterium]|nr:hypothetical protein [Chromatiales bacterium]
MERFPGIFVAATNLMCGIDGAALRRFDFKLHVPGADRRRSGSRSSRARRSGMATAPVPPACARHLETARRG